MNKPALCSAVKGKLNNHGGFSYREMLMVVFILSLCTGVISDTLALGVRHLQERTKQSQAIILLDTLFASVRNDLTYATRRYDDGAFDHIVHMKNGNFSVKTQYGVVDEWPKDKSDSYQNPPEWTPAPSTTDENPPKGQIIRENTTMLSASSTVAYYEPVTSVENYSGYDLRGGITSGNKLRATIQMDYDNSQGFHVIIQVFNEKNVELCEKDQWIKPIQPIQPIS